MRWTDRFVKLPCEFIKDGNDNLGEKRQIVSNEFYMVLPMEIIGYNKHYSNETNEYDFRTTVDFKSRDNIIVELSIEQFEDLMNNRDQI